MTHRWVRTLAPLLAVLLVAGGRVAAQTRSFVSIDTPDVITPPVR